MKIWIFVLWWKILPVCACYQMCTYLYSFINNHLYPIHVFLQSFLIISHRCSYCCFVSITHISNVCTITHMVSYSLWSGILVSNWTYLHFRSWNFADLHVTQFYSVYRKYSPPFIAFQHWIINTLIHLSWQEFTWKDSCMSKWKQKWAPFQSVFSRNTIGYSSSIEPVWIDLNQHSFTPFLFIKLLRLCHVIMNKYFALALCTYA